MWDDYKVCLGKCVNGVCSLGLGLRPTHTHGADLRDDAGGRVTDNTWGGDRVRVGVQP